MTGDGMLPGVHLSVRGNQIVGNWLAAQIVGRLR